MSDFTNRSDRKEETSKGDSTPNHPAFKQDSLSERLAQHNKKFTREAQVQASRDAINPRLHAKKIMGSAYRGATKDGSLHLENGVEEERDWTESLGYRGANLANSSANGSDGAGSDGTGSRLGGVFQVTRPNTWLYRDEDCSIASLPLGLDENYTLLWMGGPEGKNAYFVWVFRGKAFISFGYVKIDDFDSVPEDVTIQERMYPMQNLIREETKLYMIPDHNSAGKRLAANTHVMLLNEQSQNGWFQILVSETKEVGWVNKSVLLTTLEDIPIGSRIHKIQGKANDGGTVTNSGDTLEKIIKKYYPLRAVQHTDLRTIANVILKFNNPHNRKEGTSILVMDSGDFFEGFWHRHGVNYEDIVIRANHDILIPSWDYVQENLSKVKSGSITEALVESVWEEGFGMKLALSVNLGFLVFQGGTAASISFVKKGSDIVVTVEGQISGGVGVTAGVGFRFAGKDAKNGIGMMAGAEAEANERVFSMIEFRIPLRAGFISEMLGRLVKLPFSNDEHAANEYLGKFFNGDLLNYLNRFKFGVGIEGHVRAEEKTSIAKKGDNVPTRDVGGGDWSSTTHTGRNNPEDRITSVESKSALDGVLKALRTGSGSGIKEAGIFQLSKLITKLTEASADGKLGMSGGGEYWRENNKEYIAIYCEGVAALDLDIPFLPKTALGGKGVLKFVFENTGTPGMKSFSYKGPEIAFSQGDVGSATGTGTEKSMGVDLLESGDFLDKFVDALHSIKIKKRFSINFTKSLSKGITALDGVDALVDADRKKKGFLGNASVLLVLDFEHLDIGKELLGAYATLFGDGSKEGFGLVSSISDMVDEFLSEDPLDEKIMNLMEIILRPSVLSVFQIHIEAGVGGYVGAKVGAEVKLSFDVGGSATVFYEVDILEKARQALELAKEGTLKRDILRGFPDFIGPLVEGLLPSGEW